MTDKETGKPIAGATVTVLRRVSSSSLAFEKWPRLGETKHQTDAEGHYTLTFPPDQAANQRLFLTVTAEHPNYVPLRDSYGFYGIRNDEKLGQRPFFQNIALEPAEKIFGTVVTPAGKPAAGVTVKAISMSGKDDYDQMSWTDTTTNDEGYFQIDATQRGEAVFWIIPNDFAPSAHVAHAKRGDFGRFVLEKGLVLKGRVVDVDGKPLPNVWVNVEICGGPAKKSIAMPVIDFVARSALSGQTGEFAMVPLPAGVYSLTVDDRPCDNMKPEDAFHPPPAVFLNRQITLDQDQAEKSLEVRAVPYVVVQGRFFDSAGKPSSGYAPTLWARADDRQDSAWFAAKAQLDEHGGFLAKGPRGLKGTLQLIDNDYHAFRVRVSKDAPLSKRHRVKLGALERDMTDIAAIRYRAPILLVKAVAEDGTTIKGFRATIKYQPGREPQDEATRDEKPSGDVQLRTSGRRPLALLPIAARRGIYRSCRGRRI